MSDESVQRQMTDEEVREGILKEFDDRELKRPGLDRLARLIGEVRRGRTFDSIGDGLDSYLANREARR